jgi:hypothetical protein
MELGLGDGGHEENGEVTSSSFLSTKLHFNVAKAGTTQFSIIPFSTDGLGVAYGFELLNTGAQRSQRPIEERKAFSAGQLLEVTSGKATGAAFVASSHNYFVNYSAWVPTWGSDSTAKSPASYFRAAYMPNIKGWDTGFGIQLWGGKFKSLDANDNEMTNNKTNAWIIDGQAQG